MKTSITFSLALALASYVNASPVLEKSSVEDVSLAERQTASGCLYFAAPRCCVPTVCQCANGWIYQLNQDNINRGLHGCDPPWGFIVTSSSQFPGYCCREAGDSEAEGITGEEALEFIEEETE
ncbi:hypothetical protein F4810DRAFT_289112 [Camillea tinctor]|nr:hypothetical protein F4810DRAFT_289112 [Camillea tinctor]